MHSEWMELRGEQRWWSIGQLSVGLRRYDCLGSCPWWIWSWVCSQSSGDAKPQVWAEHNCGWLRLPDNPFIFLEAGEYLSSLKCWEGDHEYCWSVRRTHKTYVTCLIKRLTCKIQEYCKTNHFFSTCLIESLTIHGISFTIVKLVKIAHYEQIMGSIQPPSCLQNCLLGVLHFTKLFIMKMYSNRFNGYTQVFCLLFDIWNSYVKLCG